METWFAGLAFAGGILSIIAGWQSSGEPWDNRKALGSLLAGIVYSVGAGMASGGQALNWFTGGSVFLSGAAANLWGKQVLDMVKNALKVPPL